MILDLMEITGNSKSPPCVVARGRRGLFFFKKHSRPRVFGNIRTSINSKNVQQLGKTSTKVQNCTNHKNVAKTCHSTPFRVPPLYQHVELANQHKPPINEILFMVVASGYHHHHVGRRPKAASLKSCRPYLISKLLHRRFSRFIPNGHDVSRYSDNYWHGDLP